MVNAFIAHPSTTVQGEIHCPGDKSITHRAYLCAALADGVSVLQNVNRGHDCHATLAAISQLGIVAHEHACGSVMIHGQGMHGLKKAANAIDCQNAGTLMRLISGILCAQPFASKLIGDASLSLRPMQRIISPLTEMGAEIQSSQGVPPLHIQGQPNLQGIHYRLPVASAQLKSALLLAGLFAQGETIITESVFTRDHSERMLQEFGAKLLVEEHTITLPGQQKLTPKNISIPGDFSAAAFFITAAAMTEGSSLWVHEVGLNPRRTGLLQLLKRMGADIHLDNPMIINNEPRASLLIKGCKLRAIELDDAELIANMIDEFPILFIACAGATGTSRFSGLGELRHKESDRISAMINGLTTLGITCHAQGDEVSITGGKMSAGRVNSIGDHRVAMAFAMAALNSDEPIHIYNTHNIATSFLNFISECRRVGLRLEEGVPDEYQMACDHH